MTIDTGARQNKRGVKVDYLFTPLPKRWHLLWLEHDSLFANGLRDKLFGLTDGAPIAVHGEDWAGNLCKQMQLDGKERPNARKGLHRFQASGLLFVAKGFVTVLFHPSDTPPLDVPSTSPSPPLTVPSLSPRSPLVVPPGPSGENCSTPKRQTEEKRREKPEERVARDTGESGIFLKPIGPAPAGTEPAEPPLASWIATQHEDMFVKRTGTTPGGSFLRKDAVTLAGWVEKNSPAYKLAPKQLAGLILDGLFASERAKTNLRNPWPLSWAASSPVEFCGLPSGKKLAPGADPEIEAKYKAKELYYSDWIKEARARGEDPFQIQAERDMALPRYRAKLENEAEQRARFPRRTA